MSAMEQKSERQVMADHGLSKPLNNHANKANGSRGSRFCFQKIGAGDTPVAGKDQPNAFSAAS